MKRTLAIIGMTVAMFGMSAASCDPVPAPIENLVTFEDTPAIVEPGACGITGTQSIQGCILPEPNPDPAPSEPCTDGVCTQTSGISTAEFPIEASPASSGPWVREGGTFNLLMRPTEDVRVRCLALGGEPAFIPGNIVDPSYGEANVYVCLNVPSSIITN